MKVKGTIVSSVQGFVKDNFPNRYEEWINSLSTESKIIFTNSILASEWYSYQDGLIKPTEVLAHLFFNDDANKAAWAIGRYSAEVGLRGIYKVFVLIATPQFIMKRGGKILASFYQGSVLSTADERPKGVNIHITEFEDLTEIAENRIGGWIEKALEICNTKNITIDIKKSMTKGDDITDMAVDWE